MRKQWIIILVGMVLLLGVLGYLGFYLVQPKWEINPEVVTRIHHGMTQQQVLEILGRPPGNYHSYDLLLGQKAMGGGPDIVGSAKRLEWTGENGLVYVYLDDKDCVITALFFAFHD